MTSDKTSQFQKGLSDLRALLLSGEFQPHDRLSETALAERLGVSRTPLRRAMDHLVEEQLLERLPTGSCRVAKFTHADIADSIELRGVLEGTAVRLAAERGVSKALAEEARECVEALNVAVLQRAEPDFDAYVPLNMKFHELMGDMSGSRIVKRELKRVYRLPIASPVAFLRGQELIPDFQASLRSAQRQHIAILDAVLKREGSRAEHISREHARLALGNLDYITKENPKLAARVPGLSLVDAA